MITGKIKKKFSLKYLLYFKYTKIVALYNVIKTWSDQQGFGEHCDVYWCSVYICYKFSWKSTC